MPDLSPRLTHGRVVLRSFAADDLETVLEAAGDPYIQLFSGLVPGDQEAGLAYITRQGLRAARGLGFSFGIADATTDRAVGQIGLWLRAVAPDGPTGYLEEAHGRAALGYWITPSARRNGYATDALSAVSEWALTLTGVHRLELYIEPWNEGSWRAAERAGYQREGLLRSWQLIGEERRDMLAYSRLPDHVGRHD